MDRIIPIEIIDKVAYVDKHAEIICNNSDYVAQFTFDDEWNDIHTKTARFTVNGKHMDVVFTGDCVKIPPVSRAPFIDIGVFAGNMATTPAYIRCSKSILCEGGPVVEPPNDVYAQIMNKVNELVGIETIKIEEV